MVTEIARFTAQPEKAQALLQGLHDALPVIARAAGCRSIRLMRCVEDDNVFLYEIEWETLNDHLVVFRNSPLFTEYRSHITGLFLDPVFVQHFERLLPA